jgi:hypothetical protein
LGVLDVIDHGTAGVRDVFEKQPNFGSRHLGWVAFVMKEDKARGPIHTTLGGVGSVEVLQSLSNLVEGSAAEKLRWLTERRRLTWRILQWD